MYENINVEDDIYNSYISQCFLKYLFRIFKKLNLINSKMAFFTIR